VQKSRYELLRGSHGILREWFNDMYLKIAILSILTEFLHIPEKNFVIAKKGI
jgi:hypothetical protein